MKLTLLLLTIGTLSICADTFSQNEKIGVEFRNVTIREAFDKIEEKTGYKFFYLDEHIDDSRRFYLKSKTITVPEFLDFVFSDKEYKYKIFDDKIVVITPLLLGSQELTVKGKVTDTEGTPLPGVNIVEKGTTNGAVTNLDGQYSISVNSPDAVLSFSFIGYLSEEIAVGEQSVIDIMLVPDLIGLDEVVVTALGIAKEKKSLGYAMQEIKSEKLNQTMNPTVSGALEGKIAGVNISQSSSGVGGSSKITIRGNSSLSGNNEPLWVVDGIPLDDGQEWAGHEWGGIDFAGSAQDINPINIESISVLKGPNAAALYGSRAANGVIVVTTKKGKGEKGLGVNYNGSFVWTKPYESLSFQEKYGQGINGVFDQGAAGSWGPEITGQQVDNWRYPGQTYALEAQTDRLLDFYNTALSQTHNIAVESGAENYSTRVSLGYIDETGITPGHEVTKYDFNANLFAQISKKLSIDSKINYIKRKGINRPMTGEYGPIMHYLTMPITIRNIDLQPGMDEHGNHVNWYGPDADNRNPYFLLDQYENEDARHRLLGYVNFKYEIIKNLSISARHGMDYYRTRRKEMTLSDIIETGGYKLVERNVYEANSEVLLSYTNTSNDISLSMNAGANKMYRLNEEVSNTTGGLNIEGAYFLTNGMNPTSSDGIHEKEIQSVYGFGQLGYKNFVYLDVTARNDWSSTLPEDAWSYFYPSFSISFIATDMIKEYGMSSPSWLTFAKLRGSYAIVGNDTDPYGLDNNFSLSTTYNNLTIASKGNQMPLVGLKPEKTKSFEIGYDLRLFNNRMGMDFTYYNAITNDQILGVNVPLSSGYSSKLINAGEIENKGAELMVYTTPVKTNSFQFDIDFNFSRNITTVNELDEKLKEFTLGSIRMLSVVAIEGEKFGDIKGEAYQRDDNGNILVNDLGLPIIVSNEVVGNMQPDWIGSVALRLKYKSLTLSGLLNIQSGGDIVSVSESNAAIAGNAEVTADRTPFVFEGNNATTGNVNTVETTAEQFWNHVGGAYGTAEQFVYDASYIKMQELALSYTFPQTVINKTPFSRASISLVGRNLFYLVKHTPGIPDAGAYNRSVAAQAYDFAGLPATRAYGISLSVNF